MKYFETKHEINSAKITTLIVVIIVLLCFVVGQNYQDQPEEYGVAINFGSSSVVDENINSNPPEKLQESEPEPEETTPEDIVEEETIEEEVQEEVEEETIEELEKAIEESKAQEAAEAAKAEAAEKAAEAEKLLQQEREEALRIKKEKEEQEAKEAKEAKEKLEKEQKEAAAKAKKEAEEKAEAKQKAQKLAAEKKARALEAKKKAEKAASDARKAEAARIAKAKAQAAAKKAAADAAAAAEASKEKGSGNQTVSFALIENVPVYPGCEGGNNAAKKKCMNDKIKQFLGQNFNKSLASNLDLKGIQKVNIFFKIDKTGRVVGIRAKAPHPKLEDEAKRVTKLLPKMKPGMQQGKPTTVSFYLPLNVKAN